MCEALKNHIKETAEKMKKENAPSFIINDTCMDMASGDATMCGACEEYSKCFPDN
jgi:hypothetical protein